MTETQIKRLLLSKGALLSVGESLHRRWVYNEMHDRILSWATARRIKKGDVKVRLVGSLSAGISDIDSDIDVSVLLSTKSTLPSFPIGDLAEYCKAVEDISDIILVRYNPFPVLKMSFRGFSIDVVVILIEDKLPEDEDLATAHTFDLVRKQDQKAFQGVMAMMFLKSVRHEIDVAKFILLVAVVKKSAKCYGVYGSERGFFNVISLCLMALYTSESCGPWCDVIEMIQTFFSTFRHWSWPRPVFMEPISEQGNAAPYSSAQKTACDFWAEVVAAFYTSRLNNRRHSIVDPDKEIKPHAMPVIMPCYPYCSTSAGLQASASTVTKEFLEIGDVISRGVFLRRRNLEDLLVTRDLLSAYRYFLVLESKIPSACYKAGFASQKFVCRFMTPEIMSTIAIDLLHITENYDTTFLRDEEAILTTSFIGIVIKNNTPILVVEQHLPSLKEVLQKAVDENSDDLPRGTIELTSLVIRSDTEVTDMRRGPSSRPERSFQEADDQDLVFFSFSAALATDVCQKLKLFANTDNDANIGFILTQYPRFGYIKGKLLKIGKNVWVFSILASKEDGPVFMSYLSTKISRMRPSVKGYVLLLESEEKLSQEDILELSSDARIRIFRGQLEAVTWQLAEVPAGNAVVVTEIYRLLFQKNLKI